MSVKLDSINLYVKDMVKTVNFYRLLGLKISPSSEQKTFTKVISSNSAKLTFYHQKELERYFKSKISFLTTSQHFNLSFRVDSPKSVDELYDKIINAGFTSFQEPSNSPWNQRVAFVLDPDENLVEINALL